MCDVIGYLFARCFNSLNNPSSAFYQLENVEKNQARNDAEYDSSHTRDDKEDIGVKDFVHVYSVARNSATQASISSGVFCAISVARSCAAPGKPLM